MIEVTPDRRIVWEFPRPGDLQPGQHFRWPDDAFYAPDGKSIVINEEEAHAVVLVDYATRRIVWQYGVSEHRGSAKVISTVPTMPTCGQTAASGWRISAIAVCF